jgi:dolichyl-phosphate beta-glucosyltransferase
MPETIVVIPCYNEEKRLDTEAYEKFFVSHPGISALFVNDGSTDGTGEVLRNLAKKAEQIELIELEENSGKAEAVRRGILKALEKNPEFVCYFDADLATPLYVIPQFMQTAIDNNYDMVLGSRIKLLGRNIKRGFVRSSLGRLFAWVVSRMMRHPVYDTQCGAKLIRAEVARTICQKEFVSAWFFDVELLRRYDRYIRDLDQDYRLFEFPLQEWTEKGDSRLTLIDYLKTPWELFKIFRS